MKTLFASFRHAFVLALMGLVLLASGCATRQIDWTARVGNYTFDQAVVEIGPPDKQAKLQDGTIVAEWLTRRGYTQTYIAPGYYGYNRHYYGPMFPTVVDTTSPDYFLRLIFGPDARLKEWKSYAK